MAAGCMAHGLAELFKEQPTIATLHDVVWAYSWTLLHNGPLLRLQRVQRDSPAVFTKAA
jgi:hypothetical protein